MKKLLVQALLVAVAGALFGWVANALSPRGLELGRDYFPGSQSPTPATNAPATQPSTNSAPGTNATAAPIVDPVVARLRSKGLQPTFLADVLALYQDPRHASGQIVFVDDRDEQHYAEGHIPGAYQFFHYRATDYLPTLLPVLQQAELIVVYCAGGDCEDSEFAAHMLRELGIPPDRLLVYVGGMKEWQANNLPQELGARGSGQLRKP